MQLSQSHKSDDAVFMAEYLAIRYPDVYWAVKLNLEAHGVKTGVIRHTSNIWARDYMPIQVNEHFVKFAYNRIAQFPQLAVADSSWDDGPSPVVRSELFVDGGNIVRGFGRAILTDKVIKANKHWTTSSIMSELEKMLEAEIVIIPIEPEDTLGHSDGIVKFVNYQSVLINDYSSCKKETKKFKAYENSLINVLKEHGLSIMRFPYAYDEWDWKMKEEDFRKMFPEADEFNPGWGYYINFLFLENVILLPALGLSKDKEARKLLQYLYPEHNIVMVDCRKLSMEGGLINCVTWSFNSGQTRI